MSGTLKVRRQELKYFINEFQRTGLEEDLTKILIPDSHNGIDGYNIRSLYFDNYANTDFFDKIDGIENRKKIRLRTYSSDDKDVKLEIKRKYGDNQVKTSVIISKEDAKELINQNYDILEKYEQEDVKMVYNIMKINHLVPVVLIDYKRKAFIHQLNNIRITVDTKISSSETNFDFFNKDIVLNPVEDYVNTILEVKYDGFLPKWIKDVLAKYNPTRTSYSKYTSSRKLFEKFLA